MSIHLTDAQLDVLAEDEKNIVYKWDGPEKLASAVPIDEVKSKVLRLFSDYQAARNEFIKRKRVIGKTEWARIKKSLLRVKEWRSFDKNSSFDCRQNIAPRDHRKRHQGNFVHDLPQSSCFTSRRQETFSGLRHERV